MQRACSLLLRQVLLASCQHDCSMHRSSLCPRGPCRTTKQRHTRTPLGARLAALMARAGRQAGNGGNPRERRTETTQDQQSRTTTLSQGDTKPRSSAPGPGWVPTACRRHSLPELPPEGPAGTRGARKCRPCRCAAHVRHAGSGRERLVAGVHANALIEEGKARQCGLSQQQNSKAVHSMTAERECIGCVATAVGGWSAVGRLLQPPFSTAAAAVLAFSGSTTSRRDSRSRHSRDSPSACGQ